MAERKERNTTDLHPAQIRGMKRRAREAKRAQQDAARAQKDAAREKRRATFRAKHPILGTILGTIKALGNAILAGIFGIFVILLAFAMIHWVVPLTGLIAFGVMLFYVWGTIYEAFTGKHI